MQQTPIARRVSFWGNVIVGFPGAVLAINAALSSDYVGAGVCLLASALAFAAIGKRLASAAIGYEA